MLHTCKPIDYIPAERLAESATCPDCGAHAALAIGVIHLGHYSAGKEVKETLIWTCSNKCFLQWEHRQFMGNA
jgi:hypothetical protein